MLLEHFFDFFGGGDKYISNTVVADVDSLMWTGMDLYKRAKCGIICISVIEKGYHNGKDQVQRRNEVANRQVRA